MAVLDRPLRHSLVWRPLWGGSARSKHLRQLMNADPEYRPFQFTIADLLAVMVIVAFLGDKQVAHIVLSGLPDACRPLCRQNRS